MGWDSLKYCGARLVETSDFLLQFATVYPHCAFLLKDLKDVLDKDLQHLYEFTFRNSLCNRNHLPTIVNYQRRTYISMRLEASNKRPLMQNFSTPQHHHYDRMPGAVKLRWQLFKWVICHSEWMSLRPSKHYSKYWSLLEVLAKSYVVNFWILDVLAFGMSSDKWNISFCDSLGNYLEDTLRQYFINCIASSVSLEEVYCYWEKFHSVIFIGSTALNVVFPTLEVIEVGGPYRPWLLL